MPKKTIQQEHGMKYPGIGPTTTRWLGRLAVYRYRKSATDFMGTSAMSRNKTGDEVRAHMVSSDAPPPESRWPRSRSIGSRRGAIESIVI